MTYTIPGTSSAEEAALLQQLEAIRKSGGADGGDPAQAANNALDRLARQRMAADGSNFGAAYDATLRTAEGAALYRVTKGMTAIVDPVQALASIRKIGV